MTRAAPTRFADLPLFATDQQLAEAIVGRAGAAAWLRDRLPTLAAKPGFPPIDDFHGGRAVWLVERFYRELYLRIPPAEARGALDGEEGEWKRSRRRA